MSTGNVSSSWVRAALTFATLSGLPGCTDRPYDPSESGTTGSTASTSAEGLDVTSGDGPTADGSTSSDGGSTSSDGGSTSSDGGSTSSDESGQLCNDGPYLVRSDEILEVDAAQGLLSNELGGALVVVQYDPVSAEGGTVIVNEDGSFSYQPPASLPYGTDRFGYGVEDELGQQSSGEARVVVQPAGSMVDVRELGSKGVWLVGETSLDTLGLEARGAGDVNGDGFSDVLVAAAGLIDATGDVFLFLGGPGLPPELSPTDADLRIDGTSEENEYIAVSGAGDVDGDGYADLLLGSHSAGSSGEGRSYLVLGGPSLPAQLSLASADVRFDGIDEDDYSGVYVSGVGDVNGDGHADILLGAPGVDMFGALYLIYGGPSLPPFVDLADADVRIDGIGPTERVGRSGQGIGDIDGDGHADILIGISDYDYDDIGQAHIFLGAPDLPPVMSLSDADVRMDGVAAHDLAGAGVGAAGDFNGDGFPDLFVTAPFGGNARGEIYLVLGGPGLPPVMSLADADVRIEGAGPVSYSYTIAEAVRGAGDVDGDGFDDLIMGTCMPDSQSYLLRGRASPPSVMSVLDSDIHLVGFDAIDAGCISETDRAGDVDGDGFDDFFLTSAWYDMGGVDDLGEMHLLFGDDLSGNASVLGTAADEDLAGACGEETQVIVGGRGHDVLHGDGGADVLRGGEGDDTLVIADAAYSRLDGGLGLDTLELPGGLSLETTLAPPRIVGIERVQLGLDGPSSMPISELSLINLSDTSNTLTVEGDADDEVVLLSGTWLPPVMNGGYAVYGSSTTAAVLEVAASVTVTLR